MTGAKPNAQPVRLFLVTISSALLFSSLGASFHHLFTQNQKATNPPLSFKRMADGKQWTTQNLNVNITPSYCYDDAEKNCLKYGRLYPWESAQRACQSLGTGWRLPTDDDWRQMAKDYGGVSSDSEDKGAAAYKTLMTEGESGFNAVLGGGRSEDGKYERLEAHGVYWTASEIDSAHAWFYNFGKGGQALHRQSNGEKPRAFAVRCIKG